MAGIPRLGVVLEKANGGFVTEQVPWHASILTRNNQPDLN